jgi:hypothetical protein
VCAKFQVFYTPAQNAVLRPGDAAIVEWKGIPPDASMKLSISQAKSIAGLFADVPIGGYGVLHIPVSQLPGEGDYIWRAWLQHPAYGAICVQQGAFSLRSIVQF